MKTMVATPNPVKVGASERGRDEGKKSAIRGKSRDVVTNLKARVSPIKSNLSKLGERVDDLDGRCNGSETENAEIHKDIKNALGGLETDLKREIESLHSKIAKV
ncbi:hypothetical protein PanWU01x14_261930 [Parasponia andersonii]|uniref:Uncharacterized protein n=1 Tax=Parasponia andersonii TaxID=3476 RepID=A0A2P5B8B6_PARAD|nr:hypothetical protein PanWU01x14_261930 [Parasponia andersonii]